MRKPRDQQARSGRQPKSKYKRGTQKNLKPQPKKKKEHSYSYSKKVEKDGEIRKHLIEKFAERQEAPNTSDVKKLFKRGVKSAKKGDYTSANLFFLTSLAAAASYNPVAPTDVFDVGVLGEERKGVHSLESATNAVKYHNPAVHPPKGKENRASRRHQSKRDKGSNTGRGRIRKTGRGMRRKTGKGGTKKK